MAEKIDGLSDEDLNEIGRLATKYIATGGYISKHIVIGAIEFFEGKMREPKRKKRDMSFYKEKEPEPKENVFQRFSREETENHFN